MEKSAIASRITFEEVRALAANEGWGKRLLDQLDRFLGAAILLTPAVLGPPGIIALSFLEPKDELIKIGRSLIKRFSKPRTEDFVARRRRMTAAYCLMTYTAFFAALDAKLPDLARMVALTDEERSLIAQRSRQQDSPVTQPQDVATVIEFPHPAMAPKAERAVRVEFYQRMAQAYLRFVQGLAVWDSDGGQRSRLTTAIKALPEVAAEIFESQYLELIIEYPEFHRWAELHELAKSRQLSSDLIGDLEEKIRLYAQAVQGIDVGLRHLNELVAAAGQRTAGEDLASRVTRGLQSVYVSNIEQPIIDDQQSVPAALTLTYPKKCDIFVPQSFQAIRYLDPKVRLELEGAWEKATTGQDLGAFTLRYLESAYSTEALLLVLGHPGSGKSLFTEMIAARFAPPRYHPIRIELRDINADAELQEQIERQIYDDTGHAVNWASIADEWRDNPPVIILDGYDELLQASGKIFSSYLRRVQAFQRREALQGRPVRVIVTSRIALIDKTLMPPGVTVVRLQDFDRIRRDQWIHVWNETNSAYFAATGVRPFSLGPKSGSSHLGAQPLLLLMLAIYDSEANELRHADLDRTLLYHRLLARFIERERTKGGLADEFRALTLAEQDAQIESDLERLGVTALGMFNRRSLYIEGDALNKDIEYFGLGRERDVQSGRRHTQAELLLGRFFFFIHESKSGSGTEGDAIAPTAFEFLHNTFGEFLTADFILRKVLTVTNRIRSLSDNPLHSSIREKQLAQPPDDWLACMVFASLHTRPVVCSMMREWLGHRLRMEDRQPDDFEEDLTLVTLRQLREVLAGNAASTVSRHVEVSPYGNFSMLGHLAVYSLNLVLLVLTLTRGDVTVVEASLAAPLAGCRPWDRLISLWRSWFSLESLVGLRSAMQARRRDEAIVLSRPGRELAKGTSGLEDTYNVADSLADDVAYGLAAPHVFDVTGVNREHLPSAAERLSSRGMDLFPLFAARTTGDGIPWLRSLADHMSRSGYFNEAEKLARRALEILEVSGDRIGIADTYVQLARFMYSSGQAPAAEDSYQKAVEVLNPLGSLRRMAEICREVAELKSAAGILDEAQGWSERAAEIFERLGDEPGRADTYRQLGSFILDGGRPDSARPQLALALNIFERSGNQTGIAETCRQLGQLASLTRHPVEAERYYRRALEIFERLNDQLGIARTSVQIGQFRRHIGRFDQAESSYRRAVGIFGRAGAWRQLADAHYWLGMIAQQNRRPGHAENSYRRALDILLQLGDRLLAAPAYDQLGNLYQEQGQVEAAESSYRRALDIYLEKKDQRAFQTASMLAGLLAEDRRHLEACDVLLSSARESYEITGNWDLVDLKSLNRERQILGHSSFSRLITARFSPELQNELVTAIKNSSRH